MLRFIAIAAVVLLASLPARAETLNVYTYESFVSEWGPGPAIEESFEASCGCDLQWTAVDDAAVLLSRLRLEGAASPADVVLGLDTNLMAEARAAGLVRAHGLDPAGLELPIAWEDPDFLPFDYGYLAVIHDAERLPEPPRSLAELVAGGEDKDLIIQDPRTSTPGLGLLLWIKAVHGDGAVAAWRSLSSRVLTVTRGWSEAYGLFLAGEAPMVLSYTTSPAYHRLVEGESRYQAAIFPEGHYLQVELAAMAAGTEREALAREFLAFVTTPGFQGHIPTGNWMYPVIDLGEDLPAEFRTLPRPETAHLLPPEEVGARRAEWIDEWLQALVP